MKKSTLERARSYLAPIPGAVAFSDGHAVTFRVACVLVNGFGLSFAEAMPLFREWNSTCDPVWLQKELDHKLSDACKVRHTKPRGYLLEAGAAEPWTRAIITSAPERHPHQLPDRTGFGPGTAAQIQTLASLRPYHRQGLEWAHERGLLVFGDWHGLKCYGVADSSGRVLELRRMDGQLFPAIVGTALTERKSHAVKHSQKAWPLGILEAQNFPAIAVIEGLPDILTAHYVALWEQASHYRLRDVRCAPVAMLSSSPAIHPDALPLFQGKFVRIFAHAERAGLQGAAKWQAQLKSAGAAGVDVFDFSAYHKTDGSPVNDLWEFVHELHPADHANPATWRTLP